VKILFCDALLDNLGAGVDDWRTRQVRAALQPLKSLASDFDIAVIGSMHPNKHADNFRQLVSGSSAFNAMSRSSLLLAEHPEDDSRRVLVRGKGNLSMRPRAVEFEIGSAHFAANGHDFDEPQAVNFAESDLTVDDLIGTPSQPAPAGEARTEARDLIAAILADGEWQKAAPILTACGEHGVYERAAERAATDLGVERRRHGYPARSEWRLPVPTAVPTHLEPVGTVGTVGTVDLALFGGSDSSDSDQEVGSASSDRPDSDDSKNTSTRTVGTDGSLSAEEIAYAENFRQREGTSPVATVEDAEIDYGSLSDAALIAVVDHECAEVNA
jgi:hypothetical protein